MPKGIAKNPAEKSRKISEKLKGKKWDKSYKRKGHPAWNKGLTMEASESLRVSAEKRTGLKRTEDFCKRMSGHAVKRRHSPETRMKMSVRRMGHAISDETKKKISVANGRKKGWVTPENHRIRGSSKYDCWRKAVFKRDNWTCVTCKARSGSGKPVTLNADHIKPFAYYPELRFELSNGRTLCKECHRKTDTYGWRIYSYIRKEKAANQVQSDIK